MAEVMTRPAMVGRRLPSYEVRTYDRRDAFSGRMCAAKEGWTGAAAPVQRSEESAKAAISILEMRVSSP